MAYSGWLLKIGDYIIDTKKFIRAESYSAYVNMQDLDDYTDANGYLHRNVVELKAEKIEFETPFLFQNDFNELMRNIRTNYTVPSKRQCKCHRHAVVVIGLHDCRLWFSGIYCDGILLLITPDSKPGKLCGYRMDAV